MSAPNHPSKAQTLKPLATHRDELKNTGQTQRFLNHAEGLTRTVLTALQDRKSYTFLDTKNEGGDDMRIVVAHIPVTAQNPYEVKEACEKIAKAGEALAEKLSDPMKSQHSDSNKPIPNSTVHPADLAPETITSAFTWHGDDRYTIHIGFPDTVNVKFAHAYIVQHKHALAETVRAELFGETARTRQ